VRLLRVPVSAHERAEAETVARLTQLLHDPANTRRCTRKLLIGRALVGFADHDTTCRVSLLRDAETFVGAFGPR